MAPFPTSEASPLDEPSRNAEVAQSEAESRLAELDAVEMAVTRPWQFQLRHALVLLTLVGVYLGMTRWWSGLFGLAPFWLKASGAVAVFIWLVAVTLRTGNCLGLWRRRRHRWRARREALQQLVDAKRTIHNAERSPNAASKE